jgi:hypothetical protein
MEVRGAFGVQPPSMKIFLTTKGASRSKGITDVPKLQTSGTAELEPPSCIHHAGQRLGKAGYFRNASGSQLRKRRQQQDWLGPPEPRL